MEEAVPEMAPEMNGEAVDGGMMMINARTHTTTRRGRSSATTDMGGSRMVAGSKKTQLFLASIFFFGWIL